MKKYSVGNMLRLFVYLVVLSGMFCGTGRLVYRYVWYGEYARSEISTELTEMSELETWTAAWEESRQTAVGVPVSDREQKIRVQLLSQDYESGYHDVVSLTSETAFWVARAGADETCLDAGTVFSVCAEDMTEGEWIRIVSDAEEDLLTVTSFTRADGAPQYAGELLLYREPEGILLVNELPLEVYLYGVVASEIPSSYPQEAQKAQAVCARTYAVRCMQRAAEQERFVDLDDSVSWQVYNNYRTTAYAKAAVDSTAGELLSSGEALYYSTSCLSEQRSDLGTDASFAAFLNELPDEAAEYGSLWIRWNTMITHEDILAQLQMDFGCEWDQLDRIAVKKRSENGQVTVLELQCRDQTVKVEGEYQIRRLLSPKSSIIYLKDASMVHEMRMLPSAYFTLEDSEKMVYISGGGYGHGIGMSQCGCAAMAEAGADYKEILQYYYHTDLIQQSEDEGLE